MQKASHPSGSTAPRASMIESLERRELLAAVVNEDNIKVRNVTVDGVLINQSVITVPLTEKVDIANGNLIQVRGYATDPFTGGQKKLIINVLNVEVIDVPGTTYGLVSITTDRLMRKGGRIYFYAGSLTNRSDGTPVAEQIVRSPRGLNKERFTLASRAFRPTDVDFFNKVAYSDASDPTAADDVVSDATALADLTAFLEAKVFQGKITDAERDAALDIYDDAINRLRVPDHNMRAALVSLTGTFAESAIETFLTGNNASGEPYTILAFAETSGGAVIADTQVLSNGRLRLRIKPAFQGEHFAAISAILAHESIHQDATFTIQEEVIGNVFQDLAYAQQLGVDESIAAEGTSLVKFLNTQQLALVNSGRTLFPFVGLHQAPILHAGNGVFHGGRTIPGGAYVSYHDYNARQYIARGGISGTSPGNATLEEYVSQHLTADAPAGDFSDTLINRLDANIWPVLTNALAIRVAQILRLTV